MGVFVRNRIKNSEESLFALGAKIRAEHDEARSALSTSLLHARRAGDLLRVAQERCGSEGKPWRKWLADHPQLPERTGRLYMRVAKHWARVKHASSIREAVEMLREPKSGNGVTARAARVSVAVDRELVSSIKQFYNSRTAAEAVAAALAEACARLARGNQSGVKVAPL